MRCNEFLLALETGGFLQRLRAHRHAARCPQCAAARAKLLEFKEQLATATPLTPRQQQLWKHVAADPAGVRPGRRWLPVAASLAGCAVVVAAIWLARHRHGSTPEVAPELAMKTVIIEVDPAPEFAHLAAAAERLDAELQKLEQQAERMDAQRQVAMTLSRFGRW